MRKLQLFGIACYLICQSCLLVSCSNQQLYEAIQADGIQQCELEATEAAREACLEAYETSYEEYEEAREADIEIEIEN